MNGFDGFRMRQWSAAGSEDARILRVISIWASHQLSHVHRLQGHCVLHSIHTGTQEIAYFWGLQFTLATAQYLIPKATLLFRE